MEAPTAEASTTSSTYEQRGRRTHAAIVPDAQGIDRDQGERGVVARNPGVVVVREQMELDVRPYRLPGARTPHVVRRRSPSLSRLTMRTRIRGLFKRCLTDAQMRPLAEGR